MTRYPYEAGWKEDQTSRDAAEAIEASGCAATLRERVERFFASGRQGTSEDVAKALAEPFQAVQPRISELRKLGKVEPSGLRAQLSRGGKGHIWRWKATA